MTDIVRCPHCGTDYTPDLGPLLPDLLAEIGRLKGEVERLTAERTNRYWEGRWRDEAAEVERLTAEVEEWRERWAAERRDHEATIKAFDKAMNEGSP